MFHQSQMVYNVCTREIRSHKKIGPDPKEFGIQGNNLLQYQHIKQIISRKFDI